jgi:hypothetical protein
LLGEALVSSAALKALLPAVPKIHPQLPTFNQSVHVNNTAQACNETEINANRTADMTRLKCNATSNSTMPSNKVDGGGLPGIGFFKNLQDMNNKFQADTKDNKNKTAATGSDSTAAMASKKAQAGGYGLGSTANMFEAFKQKQSRQGAAGPPKPPDQPAAKAAVQSVGKQRYTKPIGPQKPPGLGSSSSKST